jgi:hypothetical protein
MESRSFYIILFALCLFCCKQQEFETETELLTYLKDDKNNYIQHKTINGFDYTLMYRPTDLLVKQELGDSIDNTKVDELIKKYGQYMYFNLSMSRNNQELLSTAPKDRNEFGAMVNQLAFGMGEKVHLFTQAKDTIDLADFIYPRMYGMSQSTTIMFVYPREEKALESESLNFTIEDIGLHTGEVKFKIPTDIITNQPSLVF